MGKEHGELHLEGFNGPGLEWDMSVLLKNLVTTLHGTIRMLRNVVQMRDSGMSGQ